MIAREERGQNEMKNLAPQTQPNRKDYFCNSIAHSGRSIPCPIAYFAINRVP